MNISAPVAPENHVTFPKEGEDMAAAQLQLKVIPQRIRRKTLLDKINEGLNMAIQKATSPSVAVSPAIIGLLITIIVQFGAGIWWGASISKDSSRNAEEIKTLQSENATLKVYLDNLREKQIKMEATQDNLVREQQVLNLMIQKGNK